MKAIFLKTALKIAIWVFFRGLKSKSGYFLGFSKKISDEHTYHFYIKSAPPPPPRSESILGTYYRDSLCAQRLPGVTQSSLVSLWTDQSGKRRSDMFLVLCHRQLPYSSLLSQWVIKDDRAFCYCASWNIPLYASSSDSLVRFVFYFLFYLKWIV